ncbi:MAG: hypothetical protein QNJ98_17960 [Planctomycetota bacterium]|nr:hypothetical protein [Planctomycetota bacterium]
MNEAASEGGGTSAPGRRRGVLACVLLTLAGLVAGGLFGWHRQETVYESHGLINIVLAIDIIEPLSESAYRARLPKAIRYHVELLRSPKATALAVKHIGLEDTSDLGNRPPVTRATFPGLRGVEVEPDGAHIRVTFRDRDPGTAYFGVEAFMRAHRELTEDLRDLEMRQRALGEHLNETRMHAKELREQLRAIGAEDGNTVPVLAELKEAQARLADAELRLTMVQRRILDAQRRPDAKEVLADLRKHERELQIKRSREEKQVKRHLAAMEVAGRMLDELGKVTAKEHALEREWRRAKARFAGRGLPTYERRPLRVPKLLSEPTVIGSLPWAALGGVWGLVLGLAVLGFARQRGADET